LILMLAPVVLAWRMEQLRRRIDERAEPAAARVDSIVARLGVEEVSVRGFLLTRDQAFVRRYRLALEQHRDALVALQRIVPLLDAEATAAVSRLEIAIRESERAHEGLLLMPAGRETNARLVETQQIYESTLREASLLSSALGRYSRTAREQIREQQQNETMLLTALGALSLLSGGVVLWLARTLRSVARQLDRRAQEEASLRKAASALTGAIEVDEVLLQITESATLITRADGVYVEKVLDKNTVEVIATSGHGVPPRGLSVGYPGSLTEEIIKEKTPLLLRDLSKFGKSMAPYLQESCEDCQVLVLPLHADEELLGALVLLNGRKSGREFHPVDVNRAKVLGDLASLALRRVRMLERERSAREDAQRSAKMREEVLGIVSHDLKNPLTTIRLSAQLLVDVVKDEEDSRLITDIQTAAARMQRLIRDLLDAARLEHAPLPVDRRPLDTNALLRGVCRMHRQLAESREIALDCTDTPDLPEVIADSDRILQVFDNLIGNALKFTPAGGSITLEAEKCEREIRFSIIDSGSGVSAEDRGRLFTRFWQAQDTAHLGAGLGLTIAKGIVEAHGGEIGVEDGPGGGARFWFTLPVAGA